MAQPYRVNLPGGIKIEATGEIIYPGDEPAWKIYEAWLAEQPGPDVPGGPVPPGTGLLPYLAPVYTLAELRAEALARLDGVVSIRRISGTVDAAGHSWAITWPLVLAVLVHRAAMPPVPPGFSLPNAARVQVPLNSAELTDLVTAISARLVLVNSNHAALVAAINASATPLAVNLDAGWPA